MTGEGPTEEMPVFPLGSVLLPGQLLPLQVFEPRYKVMLFDLREEDPAEFAVVLIERGSEVGGGDERCGVGCVARILGIQDSGDGRVFLVAEGTERVRIDEWLDEDPYPRARVSRLAEAAAPPDASTASDGADTARSTIDATTIGAVTDRARRVGDLVGRLGGERWPADLELEAEPVRRVWQLALLTPLATIDRQRLLEMDDPGDRLRSLDSMLEEQEELLGARLEWESGDDG